MILVGLFVVLALCCERQAAATAVDSYPGLDFVPRPDPANKEDTLIYYKLSNEASVNKLTTKIDQFLEQYKGGSSLAHPENWISCSAMYPPFGDKICDVSLRSFDPCIAENFYNYKRAAPCVFLKLDKVLNWKPNLYNKSEELPTDMPADLKDHIKSVEQTDRSAANTVWVSCEGENPADVEFIGPVEYHPQRGFPSYYFPVTSANQKDYLSPLVAVHFRRPAMGIVINIECKAWAKNIFLDRYEKRGSVHFELMVDP